MWGIPAVLLLLVLAVWATRRPGQPAATASLPAADTGVTGELHERFLRLEGEAAQRLADGDSTAAAPPATAPPATAGEAGAAAQVQAAVLDLHAAWSAGDLERMMAHYADHVDFYGAEGTPSSTIRRDRARTIERYPRRRITINRQAVLMERPDQARVLVDKEWDFTGSGERWTGSMRQELILRLRDGVWRVVSEKSTEVFGENRTRI